MATNNENKRSKRDENEVILLEGRDRQIKGDPRHSKFTEAKNRYWDLYNKIYPKNKKDENYPKKDVPDSEYQIAKREEMKRKAPSIEKDCTKMMEDLVPHLYRHVITSVLNLCGAPGGFCKPLLNAGAKSIDLFTLPDGVPIPKHILDNKRILINKLGQECGDVVKLAFRVKG